MKITERKSILKGIPGWGLSMLTVVLACVLMGIIGKIAEVPAYIIYSVTIIVACFFICRNDPKSVWYVPIISNAFSFVMFVLENSFWSSYTGLIITSGVLLSVISSIGGAWIGRRKTSSDNS